MWCEVTAWGRALFRGELCRGDGIGIVVDSALIQGNGKHGEHRRLKAAVGGTQSCFRSWRWVPSEFRYCGCSALFGWSSRAIRRSIHWRVRNAASVRSGLRGASAAPILFRCAAFSICGVLILGFVGGCIPQPRRGVDSPEPALRLEAMRQAAERKDRSAIVPLIGSLDSDDPATRLLAIRTLEEITGLTHGYDYASGEKARGEAVARWAAWAEAEGLVPAAARR